jgi:hypothetical protein
MKNHGLQTGGAIQKCPPSEHYLHGGLAGTPHVEEAHFKACIFDLDGVLLDSEPIHKEIAGMVIHGAGLAVPDDWFAAKKGHGPRELLESYAAESQNFRIVEEEMDRLGWLRFG